MWITFAVIIIRLLVITGSIIGLAVVLVITVVIVRVLILAIIVVIFLIVFIGMSTTSTRYWPRNRRWRWWITIVTELASGVPTGRIERILLQRSKSSETTRQLLWFWLSSSRGIDVAEGWGKWLWERPTIGLRGHTLEWGKTCFRTLCCYWT